jgi:DNA invertase Pin-like site-specific DNA recombinase
VTDLVALYARVSTADQDLEGQLAELRSYASRRGWRITAVYAEKTSASGKVAREAYERLRSDARVVDRPWIRVLVWSLDRWSRDPSFVKAIGSIEELETQGIRFHSVREPGLDTGEDGSANLGRDVLRGLLPAIASFEARRRSENTQLAMDELRSGRRSTRSGRPVGRPRKVTDEHLAEIIRLREGCAPPPTWSSIAVRVHIAAGTCKKVYSAHRRKTPRVEKGL